MSKKNNSSILEWFNHVRPIYRLLFSLVMGFVLFTLVRSNGFGTLTATMAGWDAFSFGMIVLSWVTFATIPPIELMPEVKEQDESRSMIFIIILLSVCVSLVGTLLLQNNDGNSPAQKELNNLVSLSGIALSWILLHTIFTLRYAHLYYMITTKNNGKTVPALDFPEEEKPDYIDFAYFSFVIGMTFQVSDVEINSRRIRRFVLVHGFISFVFNTIIVALTISTISNIMK